MTGCILLGFLVWCCYDEAPGREPEGTVFFDHVPEPGEGLVLCDGRIWKVVRVSERTWEVDAVRVEDGY